MRNFQDTFETRNWSFISDFSIRVTVPLNIFYPPKLELAGWSYGLFLWCTIQNCSAIFIVRRPSLVGQRPMKSLSSVCPSVTKFSQDWIIISFSYYTDEARFFWGGGWQPEFGPNGPKSGPSFPWNCIRWYLATMSNIQ